MLRWNLMNGVWFEILSQCRPSVRPVRHQVDLFHSSSKPISGIDSSLRIVRATDAACKLSESIPDEVNHRTKHTVTGAHGLLLRGVSSLIYYSRWTLFLCSLFLSFSSPYILKWLLTSYIRFIHTIVSYNLPPICIYARWGHNNSFQFHLFLARKLFWRLG